MNKTGGIAVRMEGVAVEFSMSRRFRGRNFQALHDVSLTLRHGQKLGVVGNNGAGKSTLLRVLAGVLRPDRGTIERNHGSVQLLSLGLGFVPHLTGRQNAVLSGLMLGMRRRDIVSRLEEIKEFSGLGDFFDEPLATYSSGMRSRLGFSVALQRAPDLLLIDETLAVGDPPFRERSKDAIQTKLRSEATVVLVAHDQNLISSICDQCLWLESGRSVMEGDSASVLSAYSKS